MSVQVYSAYVSHPPHEAACHPPAEDRLYERCRRLEEERVNATLPAHQPHPRQQMALEQFEGPLRGGRGG